MKICDVKGAWYLNTGHYTYVDTESGTRFAPGELVKATKTAWVKGQPTIVEQPSPEGAADKPATAQATEEPAAEQAAAEEAKAKKKDK